MKKFVSLLTLLILGFILLREIKALSFGEERWGVSKKYVEEGIEDNRASNIVTSIVVNYRGFDTVGEVTVLFLAATGLSFFLAGYKIRKRERGYEPSTILFTSNTILFPLILLLGGYIFIHGHLTPGGGFQGGTVVATGVLFLILSRKGFHPSHLSTGIPESLSGIGLIIVGFLGLMVAGSFLANKVLPLGEWNRLFSSGLIPIIYILIGIKVGAELSGLVSDMIGRGG